MKRLNLGIKITTILLNYIMLISLAWICSNAVWWTFSPIATNPYASSSNIKQYDKSIKYINNRAPFGVIIVEKTKVAIVSDNIKLTGIYLNTIKDSIAFIEVNKKPIIVKIGDDVIPGTKLDMINADKVILNTNGLIQELPLVKGAAEANTGLNIHSNTTPTHNMTNQQQGLSPQIQSGTVPQTHDEAIAEINAKRKKMMEAMMTSDSQTSDTQPAK